MEGFKTALKGATDKSLDQKNDQMSNVERLITLVITLPYFFMAPLVLFNKVETPQTVNGNPAARFNAFKDKLLENMLSKRNMGIGDQLGMYPVGKKVLIIKLRDIGDSLSIIPVATNLKKYAPHMTIDVMINRGAEELLANHPAIRKIWIYERKLVKRSHLASIAYHKNLFSKLRSEKYDSVIDFSLGDRSSFISFMTGARERISYEYSNRIAHLLMNRFIRLNPFEHHIVDYQLESLRLFGLHHFERNMKVYIPETVQTRVDNLLSGCGINSTVAFKVAIHPGARKPLRQWRPERFAEIANRVKSEFPASSIILIGAPDELRLVQDVEKHMRFEASFKSTDLSLIEMAALFSKCHLFVGNDSGPGHVAAAAGCPTLSLFGPNFPHLWRPIAPIGRVVFKNVPCCGCRQDICIRPGSNCMDLIGVDDVWDKIKQLLPHLLDNRIPQSWEGLPIEERKNRTLNV